MYPRGKRYHPCIISIIFSLLLLSIHPAATSGDVTTEGGPRDVDSIYWPFLGRDSYHNFRGTTENRGLMDPMVEWDNSDNSTSWGAVSGDFSGNVDFQGVDPGTIMGIADSNDTHLTVFFGDTGEVMWSVDVRDIEGRLTNRLFVAPALLDTDDDSRLELVCSITDGNLFQVVLFEPNITLDQSGFSYDPDAQYYERVWITELGPIGPIRFSSPIAHDLGSDGVEDIIFGAGNSLFALHGNNGTVFWSLDIGPIGEVLSSPAIYPSPSLKRLVVNSLSPTRQALKTTVITFQGEHLKNVSRSLSIAPTYSGPVPVPVVGNVVGTSSPEILVSYPSISAGRIRVYDYSLEELLEISDILGYVDSSCSIGDINGDSKNEIFIQSRYITTRWIMNMYCFEASVSGTDYSYTERWVANGPIQGPNTDRLHSSPLVCDLDDDLTPDVVFPGNGWLYAITSDGDHLWNLSVENHLFASAGVVGDLTGGDFTSLYIDGYLVTQQRIDLYVDEPISDNIYLSEEDPVEGRKVSVNCLVKNNGNYPASDVVVKFIDSYGGVEETIGFDTLDGVATTAEARVEWSPDGAGDHTIIVVLDPDDNITEMEEGNNLASRVFPVGAAKSDLSVTNITYVRGDGEIIDGINKHPVHGDPSMVRAEVVNLGFKMAEKVQVWAFVDDVSLEPAVIDELRGGRSENVTFDWTPDQQDGGDVLIGIFVDHPELVPQNDQIDESDESNNNLTLNVTVKSRETGSLSYLISGYTYDNSSDPLEDVTVTMHNNRTGEEITVSSGSDGFYEGDLRSLESGYLDLDEVSVLFSKGQRRGREYIRVYSEDGGKVINKTLTNVPTTGISISPQGDTNFEVDSGAARILRFNVLNTGNSPGDVELERIVYIRSGNTTPPEWETSLDPGLFTLNGSEERLVTLRVDIPPSAEPGDHAEVEVIGVIEGREVQEANISYHFMVNVNTELFYEFKTEKNRTVNLGRGEADPVEFEIYLNNRGNVPISWSAGVKGELLLISSVDPEDGTMNPGEVQWVTVTVTVPEIRDTYEGKIELLSGEAGIEVDWDVMVDVVIPNIRADGTIIVEPDRGNLGEEVTLSARIINEGGVDVGAFSCSLVVDGTLENEKEVRDGVRSGEDVSVVFLWTPDEAGSHDLAINLDSGSEIDELDEDDNRVNTTLVYRPDLLVRSASISEREVSAGDPVTCDVVVENQGNAPQLGGFTISIRLGSRDGTELESSSVSKNLDPLGTTTTEETVVFTAPEEGGTYSVFVVIETGSSSLDDPDNNFDEVTLEVRSAEDQDSNVILIVGIFVAIVLIMGAAAFFFLKSRSKIEPPPEGGGGIPEGTEEETTAIDEEEPQEEADEDVLEMSIESPEEVPEEDVVMAAVVEDEEMEGDVTLPEPPEEQSEEGPSPPDEEEMIPEV